MIIDKLSNSNLYDFKNLRIKKALYFLSVKNFSEINDGKYEIEGDNIFAIINTYNTKNDNDAQLEAHRKYIDVQYVASGSELVGYAPLGNQKVIKNYNEENDYELFGGDCSYISFSERMFAIFFPGDLHKPGIKDFDTEEVKKIVVKVKL